MTDSSSTRLAYVKEAEYGVTPTAPAFQEVRYTSESINGNISNVTSNEVRSDRNVSDTVQVDSAAGGALNFEMSYGSFDDFIESLMQNAWSGDVIKNGVDKSSFTIEKTFKPDAGDIYHRFAGCMVNSMSVSAQLEQIVTGSFDFLASGISTGSAELADASYIDANTNNVSNAISDFNSFSITGASVPDITSISLNITNNLAHQKAIGSLNARGIRAGRFEVTGEMTAYFENAELYDMFVDQTQTSIAFELGRGASKKYLIELPKIKFEAAPVENGGNDQDIMIPITFRALYDSAEDCTLKITRTA